MTLFKLIAPVFPGIVVTFRSTFRFIGAVAVLKALKLAESDREARLVVKLKLAVVDPELTPVLTSVGRAVLPLAAIVSVKLVRVRLGEVEVSARSNVKSLIVADAPERLSTLPPGVALNTSMTAERPVPDASSTALSVPQLLCETPDKT